MLRSGSKLNLLIGINIVVFLLVNIADVLAKFLFNTPAVSYYTNEYLLLPAYLPKLLTRFWTPLTYMFMHAGIWHILFNMLWFYWFGQIFEEYLGKKRTLGLYIMEAWPGPFYTYSAIMFFLFLHM